MIHPFDWVEVTKAAAIAAHEYIGLGDKLTVDEAATNAMHRVLNTMEAYITVSIGEGKKDKSHGLFAGEKLGDHQWCKAADIDTEFYLAVDPVDGTGRVANGEPGAISALAVSDQPFYTTELHYMRKIVTGSVDGKPIKVGLAWSCKEIVSHLQMCLDKDVISVCMLDRPRNSEIYEQLRQLDCKIRLIQDCDLVAAILPCLPDSGVDLYMGIGGATEGVISAAAIRCLGGYFEGQVEGESPLNQDQLAPGNVVVSTTGITDDEGLEGVDYYKGRATTHTQLLTLTHSYSIKSWEPER